MARSGFDWIRSGFKRTGSGSGITQQMIKIVVLKDQDKKFARKARELFLALAASRMMSKPEIFTAYANHVYLGHIENGPTLLGVEAAAQEYEGQHKGRPFTATTILDPRNDEVDDYR